MKKYIYRPYNRKLAVQYAHKWALGRSPVFADFEEMGGDCTNFASQCIYAGAGEMNPTPTYGWYYYDLHHRAPAWTGVVYLYQFLTENRGIGPYAAQVPLEQVEPGDIIQLRLTGRKVFHHTPVVLSRGNPATPDNILVAAHSIDSDSRPLSTYAIEEMRCLHILGVRSLGKQGNFTNQGMIPLEGNLF